MTGDDRFGDLGPGGRAAPEEPAEPPDRRSAAERFAELDEREPEPQEERPAPPRPSGRYTWVVGIAFLILIIVVAINSLPDAGEGLLGPEEGSRLPVFAAPGALGSSEQVANVKQDALDEDAGNATPACDVRGRDIVSVCEERGERPVVVSFAAPGSGGCERQFDAIERLRSRFPGVAFFGVLLGEGQPEARDLVRERGWGFPVALDRDLAIFNRYRLAVCSTTFANAAGRVVDTSIGVLSADELAKEVRKIEGRP